jgi:hypothetical protein
MKAKMTSTQAWVVLGSLATLSTALIWPVIRAIPKSERFRSRPGDQFLAQDDLHATSA